ncbi:MAG: hypothetical protein DSZ31_05025 [Gammaproteobacteria bacterium]|nr:MAG: hypothetical protein DSZ31_05025 [Gammaproteobacteria bacterium]
MNDKQIESIKERLKLYTELLRNLVILLITIGGGSVSLLFKLSNPISLPLVVLGLILTVGLFLGAVRISITLKELIEELREWEKKLEDARKRLTEKLGREPTEKELAQELNVDESWLVKLEEKIGFSYILSLEEIFSRNRFKEGFEGVIGDRFSVEETVERKELIEKLKKALEKLDDREVLVLQLTFFEELKTQHIAEILNISVGRVAQIKKKALQKLAKEMKRFL